MAFLLKRKFLTRKVYILSTWTEKGKTKTNYVVGIPQTRFLAEHLTATLKKRLHKIQILLLSIAAVVLSPMKSSAAKR